MKMSDDGSAYRYIYDATSLRVVDGDTLDVEIDLGLDVRVHTRLRLYGLDAPELHARDHAERERAEAARDRLIDLVMDHPLVLRTVKDRREKYGRYLAEVQALGPDSRWVDVNRTLLDEGLAVAVRYD